MGTTNLGSAIEIGSELGQGADKGQVVLAKRVTVAADGTASQAAVLQFPSSGVTILDMYNQTTVAHTATTKTLAVGTAAGGAQLVTATDVKALGKDVLHTDANELAFAGFTGGSLHLTFVATGATSVGSSTVTVLYTWAG